MLWTKRWMRSWRGTSGCSCLGRRWPSMMEPTRSVHGQPRLFSAADSPRSHLFFWQPCVFYQFMWTNSCIYCRLFVGTQVSRGLWKKYGDKRIIDTPISEVRTFTDSCDIDVGCDRNCLFFWQSLSFWCRWDFLVLLWEPPWWVLKTFKSVKYFRSLLTSIQAAAHQFGPSVTSILLLIII